MSALKSIRDPEVVDLISQHRTDAKYHKSPEAWEDQLFYFFLPDRFSDGNEQCDGQENDKTTTPLYDARRDRNNGIKDAESNAEWQDSGMKFVGGTIKGATSKLGYLKRMGVTAIWIGPVFQQIAALETYHGYAIQDFLNVDKRFGTREDLRQFVDHAHREGIYVILDIVLNHSGNVLRYEEESPSYTGRKYPVKGYWSADRNPDNLLPFEPVDERKNPTEYPDGAIWPKELQTEDNFLLKGVIRDWDAIPDLFEGDFFDLKSLNLGPFATKDFAPGPALITLCEVYKFWIAFADIDGFRIDTVRYMGDGPTKYFAGAMHDFARSLDKQNFFLVGEIWGSHAFKTVRETGLDAALGIGDIQDALWHLPFGQANPIDYFGRFHNMVEEDEYQGHHGWYRNHVVTMIDDHDESWRWETKGRFCSKPNANLLLHATLGLNLCSMGIPCIYYGTEQNFDGSSERFQGHEDHYADRFIREAMFGGAFGAFGSRNRHFFDEKSATYEVVQEIARLRRDEIALRRGDQHLREVSQDGIHFSIPTFDKGSRDKVIAWSRIHQGREVLCVMSTDISHNIEIWIAVEQGVHEGTSVAGKRLMRCLYPPKTDSTLEVQSVEGCAAAVHIDVAPCSFTVYR